MALFARGICRGEPPGTLISSPADHELAAALGGLLRGIVDVPARAPGLVAHLDSARDEPIADEVGDLPVTVRARAGAQLEQRRDEWLERRPRIARRTVRAFSKA